MAVKRYTGWPLDEIYTDWMSEDYCIDWLFTNVDMKFFKDLVAAKTEQKWKEAIRGYYGPGNLTKPPAFGRSYSNH